MASDDSEKKDQPESGIGLGLLKGLGVTLKTMLHPAVTQQYPHVKPDLPARTRGVIALKQENCTVCYKCSRECPDWCIYIDAHKEQHDPAGGGRARSAKILDRFAIDYALCMYCGICVEVCPFDALFWSPEFEYAEYDIDLMTHEKERLEEWTYKVLPPPALEVGRRAHARSHGGRRRDVGAGVRLRRPGGGRQRQRDRGRHLPATSCTPRSTWWSRCCRSVACTCCSGAEFVGWVQILIYVGAIVILFLFGLMLTKAPIGRDTLDNQQPLDRRRRRVSASSLGLVFLIQDAFRVQDSVAATTFRDHDRRRRRCRCSATTSCRSRRSRSCCSPR